MQSCNGSENRRVLVIDDNPTIHDDLRKILCPVKAGPALRELAEDEQLLFAGEKAVPGEEVPAFELDSAYQGRDGLALVRTSLEQNRPYAMAFVDVRMPPGWDGIETSARIWEICPDLQVVICTAYSDYSWEEIIAKLGQSERLVILKKPFENIELLQLASSLTQRWSRQQESKRRMTGLEQVVNDLTAQLRQTGK